MTDDEMMVALVRAATDKPELEELPGGTPGSRRLLAVVKRWLADERERALEEVAEDMHMQFEAATQRAEQYKDESFGRELVAATWGQAERRIRALAR